MLLSRDIVSADYPVVAELLNSNDLGVGEGYNSDGVDVIVAELHGSLVGVAEFHLDCDFGRDEGRPNHPGEQAWILTMAVAGAHRRQGVGRALVTEIARRAQDAGRTFLALSSPGRRRWGRPMDVLSGVRTFTDRARRTGRGLGLPGCADSRR